MMANIYRVVAEHVAPRKGFSDVVQPTGPIMSGQLHQDANMQLSYNSLIQLNYNDSLELGNSLILPQTCAAGSRVKHGSPEHYSYSCSPEHKHCLGLKVPRKFVATCTPGIQKEKDNAANAVLWDACFFNHQYYQYIAAQQDNQVKNIYLVQPLHQRVLRKFRKTSNGATYENFVGQPSGDSLGFLRCRRLISPCMAVTMNCPVVSPSSLTDSIASTTSCGARACTFCDFALIAFVAKAETSCCWWRTVYTKDKAEKVLTCLHLGFKVESTLSYLRCVYDEAQKDGNPLWASNHNVTETYIMACSHDTQTRPKFVYLFLGTPNEFPDSTPTVLRAEADTEVDARAKFPRWTLTFAAQIRTEAPCRLQIFSTDDGFMWVYEQRQSVSEVVKCLN